MTIGRGRNGHVGSQMDVSEILTKPQFLPRSRSVMRLLDIRQDPLAHFVPTRTTTTGVYFCAGPPGLAPELAEMFMRLIHNILGPKRRDTSPDKPNKKARLDKENIEDVEQARRAGSVAPSLGIGSDVLRRGSIGPGGDLDHGYDFGDNTGTVDDYQFNLDMDTDLGGVAGLERARSKSRFSTPAGDEAFDEGRETFADSSCPIAMFDERPSQSQSQQEAAEQDGKGYSRTTVKALQVIRKELHPRPGRSEKVMNFQEMSHKVRYLTSYLSRAT